MQEARAENLKIKGKKPYYAADQFDLSALPAYAPKEKVTGTIRLWAATTSSMATSANTGKRNSRNSIPG